MKECTLNEPQVRSMKEATLGISASSLLLDDLTCQDDDDYESIFTDFHRANLLGAIRRMASNVAGGLEQLEDKLEDE